MEHFSCEIIKLIHEDSEERQCFSNFKVGNSSEKEEIKMTINKPRLDGLLDGLHKIQNQSSNVANKNKS